MSKNYESVEVVSWDHKRLDLKKDNLLKVSRGIKEDVPIAILNVSGEFRTGKSTLLNLFISILDKYETNNNMNKIHVEDLKLDNGCLNVGRHDRKGFGWKAGNVPCTKGIWMLNHYFLIPNPKDKTKKMAVLLVDTEGLEANDSTNGSDQVLFGISNLMSSLLILNQKGLIGKDDMTNLRLLVEFCPPQKATANGSFCGIEFLMRDYKYESDELKEQLEEMKEFIDSITKSNELSVRSNLDLLKGHYRYIDFFGLPQPGPKVEKESFNGNMDGFSDEYKEIVLYFIKRVLSEKLLPTFENKEEFYGLCETLNAFLSKGIPQLSQMHKIFIENKNQMLTSEIMTKLINPLKEKLEKKNLNAEQLKKECDIVSNKLEEYRKKFLGTKEMIDERMDYMISEVEILKKECERRYYHEESLKFLEEESKKTGEERKILEQKRLEYERKCKQTEHEIEMMKATVASIKPTVIIETRYICVIQ